jgi:GH24 family phage-related lysozyme (muramidase)
MSDLFQYDTTGDMTTMGGQLSPTINVQPNMQAAKAFQGLSTMMQSYGKMKVVEGDIAVAEAKRQKLIRDEEIKKATTADYLDISTSVAQAESELKIALQNAKTPDEMNLAYSFFNESLNFELQDRRPEALEKAAKETNNTFLKGQEAYNTTMLKFGEGEQKVLETKQYTQAIQTVSAFSSYFDEQLLLNANNKEEIVKLRAKNLAALDNQFKGLSVDNQKSLSKHFAAERERVIKQSAVALQKINQTTFGNELQSASPAFANMEQKELSKHYKTIQQAGEVSGLTKEEIGEKFFTTTFNTAINSIDEESMVNNRDYATIQNLNDTVDRLLATDPKLKDKPFVLKAKQDIVKLKNSIDSAVKADIKQATTDFYLPQKDFNVMLEKGISNGAIGLNEAKAMANDRVKHMTTSPAAVTHRAESYVNAATGSGNAFNLKTLAGLPEQAAATKLVQQQINQGLLTGNTVLVSENLKTNTSITVPLVENHFRSLNKEINNLSILKVKPEQEEERKQKLSSLIQQQQQLSFYSNKYISEEQVIENQVAEVAYLLSKGYYLEVAKGTITDPQKFLVALKDSNVPLKSMSNSYVEKLYDNLPVNQEYAARVRFSTLTAAGMDESDAYDIVYKAYSLKEVGDSNISGNGAFRESLGDFDQDALPVWLDTLKAKLPLDYEEQIEDFMDGKNPQIVLNNNLLELYTDEGVYIPIPMSASMMSSITADAAKQAAIEERENASATGIFIQDAVSGIASYSAKAVQALSDLSDAIQTTFIGDPLDRAADKVINNSIIKYAGDMAEVANKQTTLVDEFVRDVYVNKMDTTEAVKKYVKGFKSVLKNLPEPQRYFEQTEEQKLETQQGAERAMERHRKALETAAQVESQAREGSPISDFLKEAVGEVLNFIIPAAQASDKPTGETISPMENIGSKENPFKNPSEMRKAKKVLYGKDAIKKVEQMEGRKLSYSEKRVVEEEAFVDGFYLDTENVLTYGVGQTRGYIEAGFKKSFDAHKKETKRIIKNFDTLPEYLQAELIQATYRGDIATGKKKDGTLLGSPNTQKLINKGEFEKAAKSFLNNNDYRKSKKDKTGIYKRMDKVAAALLKYSKEAAAADTSFISMLKQEENAAKKGFDRQSKRWLPHPSPEGGTDTIGYGHKLTKAESEGNYVLINGSKVSLKEGLTEEQNNALFEQDIKVHERIAKKHFGKAWNNMDRKVQLLATEISFNVQGGLKEYPTFTELASNPKTQEQAINEIGRTYTDKNGKKVQLSKRVNAIKKWYNN